MDISELFIHVSQHGRNLLMEESPRVLGVGVGVFLLGFFLVVCVVLGLLGSKTTKPGIFYAGSAAIYGIIVLVLLASPKGYPPPPSPIGYDQTIVPLVVTVILVSVGAFASLLGLLVFHARALIYARPLNYHFDVLNQH